MKGVFMGRNEVVKYHNDLNTVVMRGWTAEEMNLFFSIIAKIRDKGTETVVFNTLELKELTQFANQHKQRWEDVMVNTANKIIKLSYTERTTKKISVMALFSRFDVYLEEKKLVVEITKNFEYIVNKLKGNFTTYELEEFTQIRSTYAKTMYRTLKQWRIQGVKEFKIQEFKRLLDMPEYYKPSHINKNVLTPIKKELPKYFKDLKIKVIKANTQGTPVIAYKFTWAPEKVNSWDPNKYNKIPNKKATYKKKRYRSKNGSIEAKEFAERAREQRFARMLAEKEKEQGQTGEEILAEMQDLNNKKGKENEI